MVGKHFLLLAKEEKTESPLIGRSKGKTEEWAWIISTCIRGRRCEKPTTFCVDGPNSFCLGGPKIFGPSSQICTPTL